MITANSYIFYNSGEENEEKNKFNIGPVIFGAVALVSHFYVGSIIEPTIASLELSQNSVQSFNIVTNDDETVNYSLHNNKLNDSDSSTTLNFTNDDILNMDTNNEMEVLDVEDLRRLQENFDKFYDSNHEMQLKSTEQLATLIAEMKSVNTELARLNKNQDELPELIRGEFKKMQSEKSDNNKSVWIAPFITGGVLLLGQYLLGLL